MSKRLLTVREVSDRLQHSQRWVRGKIDAGLLKACRPGLKLLVSEEALASFLENCPASPRTPGSGAQG